MIETNSEALGDRLSELWATADGVRDRPVRSWKNAEGALAIRECGGSPPPSPDEEPPDHYITLSEIIRKRRDLSTPEEEARRAEDRRHFNFEEYCREHDAKMAMHGSAWIDFKRRNDLDLPPAA